MAELTDAAARELGVRIISPDRPVIRESTFQPNRNLIDWPRDLEQLANHLGIERFHIFAISGGAPYAYAVAAAIPGIIDWLSITNREVKRIADWHARLNVIALLVFAADWYLRTTNGSRMVSGSLTIPIALSVLGVILITISGWLGGELVFKHGVAVNPQHDTVAEEAAKARVS